MAAAAAWRARVAPQDCRLAHALLAAALDGALRGLRRVHGPRADDSPYAASITGQPLRPSAADTLISPESKAARSGRRGPMLPKHTLMSLPAESPRRPHTTSRRTLAVIMETTTPVWILRNK